MINFLKVHLFHLCKLLDQMDFDIMMKRKYWIDLEIDTVLQNLYQIRNHHLNENEREIVELSEELKKVMENFDNHNK